MIIRKLTSRKLWLAVSAFVALLMAAKGFSEAETAQVTAIIMAGASVLAYIISEGLVDGAHKDDDEEEETETHAYGYMMDDGK